MEAFFLYKAVTRHLTDKTLGFRLVQATRAERTTSLHIRKYAPLPDVPKQSE